MSTITANLAEVQISRSNIDTYVLDLDVVGPAIAEATGEPASNADELALIDQYELDAAILDLGLPAYKAETTDVDVEVADLTSDSIEQFLGYEGFPELLQRNIDDSLKNGVTLRITHSVTSEISVTPEALAEVGLPASVFAVASTDAETTAIAIEQLIAGVASGTIEGITARAFSIDTILDDAFAVSNAEDADDADAASTS